MSYELDLGDAWLDEAPAYWVNFVRARRPPLYESEMAHATAIRLALWDEHKAAYRVYCDDDGSRHIVEFPSEAECILFKLRWS